MAYACNSGTTGQYVSFADHAALSLGATFGLGGWCRCLDHSGTGVHWILSWDNWGANNSLGIRVGQASHPSVPGKFLCHVKDSAGVMGYAYSPDGLWTDTDWHYLLFTCDGTTLKTFFDNVQVGTGNVSSITWPINSSVPAFFACQVGAEPWCPAQFADWAKWDTCPDDAMRVNLAAGYAADWYPENRAWYLPALDDLVEVDVPLSVTDQSGGIVAGPSLVYPSSHGVFQSAIFKSRTFHAA
ncbi:MAG: hypothetical protein JW888_15635 [Pirellulales bacterium]|nr:hypothetical protein [Pirellulales bacterium]